MTSLLLAPAGRKPCPCLSGVQFEQGRSARGHGHGFATLLTSLALMLGAGLMQRPARARWVTAQNMQSAGENRLKCRTPIAGGIDGVDFKRLFFSSGLDGNPDVSLNTLRELRIFTNGAIPFEIWMFCCPEIHLDDRTLEGKLINGRRGGYCFRAKWAAGAGTSRAGFNVRSGLLGRVVLANPSQMPPRTHRLLLV